MLQDYLLKQAVRAAVPEEQFAILSNIPNLDTEVSSKVELIEFTVESFQVPEEDVPGWFSVNLRVLWTSPRLYICRDVVTVTRQLVVEIYRNKEEVRGVEY